MFDLNKVSLKQIKICSNQINLCLEANKLYLWPYTNAIICLFWKKMYFMQTDIYLAQRYYHNLDLHWPLINNWRYMLMLIVGFRAKG